MVISYHMYATLRGHKVPVRSIDFSSTGHEIASGDDDGRVNLWSTSLRRSFASWKPHENAILKVRFWGDDKLITHARDNKLKIWEVPKSKVPAENQSQARSDFEPVMVYEQDVNALNFCGFAISGKELPCYLALPATTDSEKIDVYHLDLGFKLSRPFKGIKWDENVVPYVDAYKGKGKHTSDKVKPDTKSKSKSNKQDLVDAITEVKNQMQDKKDQKDQKDKTSEPSTSGFDDFPDLDDLLPENDLDNRNGSVMTLEFTNYGLVAGYESGMIVIYKDGSPPVGIRAHRSTILSMVCQDEYIYSTGADKRTAVSNAETGQTETINRLKGRAGSLDISLDTNNSQKHRTLAVLACWDNVLRVFEATGSDKDKNKDKNKNKSTFEEYAEFKLEATVCKIGNIEPISNQLRKTPSVLVAAGTKTGQIMLYAPDSVTTSKLLHHVT